MAEGWATWMSPIVSKVHGCTSETTRRPERILGTWMCRGRVAGAAFLLVTSLWPNKEKSPARGSGRNRLKSTDTLRHEMAIS